MNPKELEIARNISKILPRKGIWLIEVKANHQIRIILLFLKALVDFKKRRGLVITMEKPHHYMTYLLGIHGISQRSLTYVDIAHSPKKSFKFPLDVNSKEVVIGGFLKKDEISPEDYDFVVVDNIGHTRMYLSEKTHQKMVKYLLNTIQGGELFALFPLDGSRCPRAYELVKKYADRTMKWEEVMKIAD